MNNAPASVMAHSTQEHTSRVSYVSRRSIRTAFLATVLSSCGGGQDEAMDPAPPTNEPATSTNDPAASTKDSATFTKSPAAFTKDPVRLRPTLLFKTNFGTGVSLSAPQGISAFGAWQPLSGTDSETGFSFPIAALDSDFTGLQLIGPYGATGTAMTTDNINDYFGNAIQKVKGPDGNSISELFFNLKIKEEPVGKANSQIPFLINRPWTVGDINNLYITYWFKHPADLASRLDSTVSSGGWRDQFAFKTGGYQGTYQGDYRLSTQILKGSDGKMYWFTKGDNVAGPWPRVDYWIVTNHTVPVPVDEWFKFEVYWHRSAASDGHCWVAVNGQIIADHWGPNMGDYNLPITRLMPYDAYAGGTGPVQGHMANLEIWDDFPCGNGRSCYVAPK